jgi:microcystin-dependent protein
MSDQFLAEIRIFPFNFPPTGWAFCNGQLLPLSQNTALFALLGTFYGGDGKSTFALPDLQGAAPMQTGQGQGLSERFLGEQSGTESVTLLLSEIPLHTHSFSGSNEDATQGSLTDSVVPSKASGGTPYQTSLAGLQPMNLQALALAGGSLPHNNMQPYLSLNFCIALQGIFPQRP